jgi:hypothetical protein
MAQHARLKIEAGVRVYFCHPHSPWQRGTNENTRASCFWDESERDSRIGQILIQPAGWAEASRRWQSRIRKTCAIG